MTCDETAGRKVEMRGDMELATLSRTGQHRIGPILSSPRLEEWIRAIALAFSPRRSTQARLIFEARASKAWRNPIAAKITIAGSA
jgi:hypothetical protein